MHGAVHANTPCYLADRISPYVPCRSLRSADQSLIVVPRVNLERLGRRAFSCAGPTVWNTLPIGLRTQRDSRRFKRDLNTFILYVGEGRVKWTPRPMWAPTVTAILICTAVK